MSPEQIDILVNKGASAEMIAELWKADLAARAAEIEERRSKDRTRQRRHRESRDVTECHSDTTDNPSLEVSPQTPLPKPNPVTPLSPPKSKGKKAGSVELPDWMPAEPWAAFVAMRKSMRNVPFTDTAAKGIIEDLDRLRGQGHDPEKLLLKAVKRGWRGVFEADDTKATGTLAGRPLETLTDAEKIEQHETNAAWFERHGMADRAADSRRKAAQLRNPTDRATGPPRPLGQVVQELTH